MSQLEINSREDAILADISDELKTYRDRFIIPEGLIYLTGNSLGCCPRGTFEVAYNIINEWAQKLNIAYEIHRWQKGNPKLNSNIAKLIGGNVDEVIVEGNTTLNIFKALGTAIGIQKIDNLEKKVIVLEAGNFSTDNHVAQGFVNLLSAESYQIRYFNNEVPIEDAIKDDTVVVLLSLVNWRTGELMNIEKITELAHKAKAQIIWDLSHAIGAIPINVHESDADYAVGCTYKHLNGGTGAPSFLWVNKKHQNRVWSPIVGWRGHQNSFAFRDEYIPAQGMNRYFDGNSQVVQQEIARFSSDMFMEVDMTVIRKKSLQLTDFFIELMDKKCPLFELATPREHDRRGGHIAYKCVKGMELRDYLRARNIQLDFRNPDIIRIALPALYMRFVDVWDTVEEISKVAAEFS